MAPHSGDLLSSALVPEGKLTRLLGDETKTAWSCKPCRPAAARRVDGRFTGYTADRTGARRSRDRRPRRAGDARTVSSVSLKTRIGSPTVLLRFPPPTERFAPLRLVRPLQSLHRLFARSPAPGSPHFLP